MENPTYLVYDGEDPLCRNCYNERMDPNTTTQREHCFPTRFFFEGRVSRMGDKVMINIPKPIRSNACFEWIYKFTVEKVGGEQ